MSRAGDPRSPVILWREALLASPHSWRAKYVGLAVSMYMSADGDNAFPSYETLAIKMGIARSTVAAGVKELVEQEWLTRAAGFGEVHPNNYSIRYPSNVRMTDRASQGTVRTRSEAPSGRRTGSRREIETASHKIETECMECGTCAPCTDGDGRVLCDDCRALAGRNGRANFNSSAPAETTA